MRAVVQRVGAARVRVDGEIVSEMGAGLLALVAVRRGDLPGQADELARKLVNLRILPDEQGRMNRSLQDVGGTLAVVSQFTLYGDCSRGRRPFFGDAADPEVAEPLLERLIGAARAEGVPVVTGRFGAHMQVELTNDGPVTLLLEV
jgi:D-tyrosyl-tRNA(Tyr) deacylase